MSRRGGVINVSSRGRPPGARTQHEYRWYPHQEPDNHPQHEFHQQQISEETSRRRRRKSSEHSSASKPDKSNGRGRSSGGERAAPAPPTGWSITRNSKERRGHSVSSSSSSSSENGSDQRHGAYQQHFVPPAGGRGRGRGTGSGGRGAVRSQQRPQHKYLDTDDRSDNTVVIAESDSPGTSGGKRPAPETFDTGGSQRPAVRPRASADHQNEEMSVVQARGDGDAGAGGGGRVSGKAEQRKSKKDKKKDAKKSDDDETSRFRAKKLKVRSTCAVHVLIG